MKRNLTAAAVAMSFLSPMSAAAADAEGNFSVRGFGSISCQDFISVVEENNSEALLAHAQWLQGYFSAQNRKKSGAFDTVPVYRAEDILVLVRSICERIPTQPVETAANASIDLFERAHVSKGSDLTPIEYNGRQTILRQAVLADMQQILLDMGYYDSSVDGLFGRNTAIAISNYQSEVGLPETGLPDLATLVEMFTD